MRRRSSLYVFDVTEDSFEDVILAVSAFKEIAEDKSKKLVLIGNKVDKLKRLPSGFKDFVELETIFVSAKRKENIQLIAESLLASVKAENLSGSPIVSNIRHLEALQNALASIQRSSCRVKLRPLP